ncbi:MAG: type II secretory pathway component PulF [Mariniblastus sp.]|jgi:type II secretory pathway component PulF
MPDFSYSAKTTAGEHTEGVIQATTHQEALRQLTQRSLFPVKVRVQAVNRASFSLRNRVSTEVVADHLTQMSDLLTNGVSLLETLKILSEQALSPQLKMVLAEIHDDVADGQNLDDAFAKHPRIFSTLTVSMIKAGMEGGFLEESLSRVSGFLEKQAALKSKIIGALTYPMVLIGVGVCLMIGMVAFIVPMFEVFFDKLIQSGVGLPTVTRVLIFVSNGLVKYGLLMVLGIAGVIYGIRKFAATSFGREFFDAYKLRIPMAGIVFRESAISRFCRVLGTLLHNGVPILKSLKIAGESVGNVVLQKAIFEAAENVVAGNRLSDPLEKSGFLTPQVLAMLRVAEESNSLDSVLVKISDRMDNKIERTLDSLVRLIEPIILLIVGAMVMGIILGVLLPIFDLTSTID